MRLDSTLAREIKKANGDGSREAKFALLRRLRGVCEECSKPSVIRDFDHVFKHFDRASIAIVLAVTIFERRDQLEFYSVRWAMEVLELWTNRPHTVSSLAIDDGLHPSRIEEYAGSFIRLTSEM